MYKYITLLIIVILTISCNNDIELNENWKEIPITYGILNPPDTAQYIRIEKGFIDSSISALEVAKISDSLYFKNLDVKIIRLKNNQEFKLRKIDGNSDNHARETGVFATSPNYLYKINTNDINLIPAEKYTLLVIKENGDTLTYSTIALVNDINIYLPYSTDKPVNLIYISNFNINWEGGDSKGYFDLFIKFHIKEKNSGTTNSWVTNEYIWKVDTRINQPKYRIEGKKFYDFLKANLEENPDIIRKFLGFDIIVRGVGREFKEYTDILNANLGITSSQQLPVYTNLENGYGIFSSINVAKMEGFFAGETTLDSLKRGVITKKLNFQ